MELTVVPDKDQFSGSVDIDLSFQQATSVLWLNAQELTIREATLTRTGETLRAGVIAEPRDLVGFSFDHPISPGPAQLHVNFEGNVSRKNMSGIFQVKDRDHWYIYSQFENISARKAFPCFDEPGYKVPWQVTLHVPASDRAFSNTPSVSEKNDANGMKTVVFAETKPLPSYLVAIAVGTLEIVDAGRAGAKQTQVRIVVPEGHSSEAEYAAKATPAILNLLEAYFGIPYPYEKLDEVAIPYAGFAMEHPGLVTYGASFFLMSPGSQLAITELTTNTIAHELAHLWSGDLVTMAWWDDAWLNEAFASWMANKIVGEYRPEWKMNIDELNAIQGAMITDELLTARKVRQQILSDDDIENAFDNITYEKGSGLLSMFESYIGAEKFRQGVQRYLRRYAWKNASAPDFLDEISEGNQKVAKAFSSFLDQPGVPLIDMKLRCMGNHSTLVLSQERLLPVGTQNPSDQLWDIPVCFEYPSPKTEIRQCLLMHKHSESVRLPKAHGCPAWVNGNASQAGYYRVRYGRDLLNSLANDHEMLSLPERVGLLGDISALSKGQMPIASALALVPHFATDPESVVVSKSLNIVGALDDHLVPESSLPSYRRYLSHLYKHRAEELGWQDRPDEGSGSRLLRAELFELMANRAEDPEFINEAKVLTQEWLEDHSAVSSDILPAVLNSAAAHGDKQLFDRLVQQARSEPDEAVQLDILRSLAYFRDPELIRNSLGLLLKTDIEIRQVVYGVLVAIPARNLDVVYGWMKENWDALVLRLPARFVPHIPMVVGGFCDDTHRADVQDFFTRRSATFPGGPRILAQALEGINVCVANKAANQPGVVEFLTKY